MDSLKDSAGEASTSELLCTVAGSQFLPGYWPEVSFSSLPGGPLHRAAHDTASLTSSEKAREDIPKLETSLPIA